jgi:CBS domain-containing protein
MRADELMSTKVQTCRPTDALDGVARLMGEHDLGCLPVIDSTGHVLALLTDRDVCLASDSQGRPLSEIRVRTAMSDVCHAVGPRDPIASVERIMREQHLPGVPVVDDEGLLVGLVSLSDLSCALRSVAS